MKVVERLEKRGRHDTADCVVCGAVLDGAIAVLLPGACLKTCRACGSWTYLPRSGAAEQAAIHDNESYFHHPYFKLRRTITPAQRRRCQGVFAKLSVAIDIASLRQQRVLDIGCDTGTFLSAARELFGVVPVGVDVSVRATAIAREDGIEVYNTTIEDAEESLGRFPVITAIDLIEHVPDPAAFLREVWKRLLPGGLVYVQTPNIRSTVYWAGRTLSKATRGRPISLLARLFPAHHIQYFTPESLGAMARVCGFEVVDLRTRVLPWSELASSFVIRTALAGLQILDRLSGRGILACALFRRPAAQSSEGPTR